MKKVRTILLVIVLILSPLLVYYSFKTGPEKTHLFIVILVVMCIYALIDIGTEVQTDNKKISVDKFVEDRATELDKLLTALDSSQASLKKAVKNGDIEEISNAEKALNKDLTSVLNFFENYSNWSSTMYLRKKKRINQKNKNS